MTGLRALCFYLVFLVTALSADNLLHPLSDEFISLINSRQSSWKAGRNFPQSTPLTYIKNLMGVIKNPLISTLPEKIHDADLIESLPENFDPREKWQNCPSLNEIRDQGSCGSCWAFGAVEAMTDRVCTYSNGTKNFYFSANDLLSCCKDSSGCKGGDLLDAWQYWKDVGIVSGGPYNSKQGCRPYEIPPCEHHVEGNRTKCGKDVETPKCIDKCQAGYKSEYNKDKHHGKSTYRLVTDDNIKAELFTNGPVEAVMYVFEDFLQYKSGLYYHTEGDYVGLHAIKVLGWGVIDDRYYWLCANSWNSDWGDKGFFKILRGENECGIEGYVIAAEPVLDGI